MHAPLNCKGFIILQGINLVLPNVPLLYTDTGYTEKGNKFTSFKWSLVDFSIMLSKNKSNKSISLCNHVNSDT